MEKGVERLSSAVCQFFQPFQGTIFDLYVFESRKAGRPFGTLAAQRQNFRAALCQFFDESRSQMCIRDSFTGNEKAEPARLGGRAGFGKYDFIRIPFQACLLYTSARLRHNNSH